MTRNEQIDDLVKKINFMIDEIDRLQKLVDDRDAQIVVLRQTLAMADGGENFQCRKAHTLKTTGMQEFLYSLAEEEQK